MEALKASVEKQKKAIQLASKKEGIKVGKKEGIKEGKEAGITEGIKKRQIERNQEIAR